MASPKTSPKKTSPKAAKKPAAPKAAKKESAPKAKKEKKVKDPNAPKRPLNPYMKFSNSIRAEVLKEQPDLKITEVSKVIGAKWKAMSDDEKAKFAN